MLARGHEAFAGENLLSNTDLFKPHMQEAMEEDLEDEQVHAQFEELKKRKVAQAAREAAARTPAPAPKRTSAASSSSSSQAPHAPKARRFVPVPATGMSAPEARGFLPPQCSLSKDTTRENRWRLRMRFLEKEVTKAYGRNSSHDDHGAPVFPWKEWQRYSGDACPFDLQQPGSVEGAAEGTAGA